jgi:DNA-binding phage protein
MTTAKASRSHDATMVEMLKSDPEFANEYLAAALDALGPRSNPTVKTILAIVSASGLHLSVAKQPG